MGHADDSESTDDTSVWPPSIQKNTTSFAPLVFFELITDENLIDQLTILTNL